jgi:hypothetical protein
MWRIRKSISASGAPLPRRESLRGSLSRDSYAWNLRASQCDGRCAPGGGGCRRPAWDRPICSCQRATGPLRGEDRRTHLVAILADLPEVAFDRPRKARIVRSQIQHLIAVEFKSKLPELPGRHVPSGITCDNVNRAELVAAVLIAVGDAVNQSSGILSSGGRLDSSALPQQFHRVRPHRRPRWEPAASRCRQRQ